MATFPLKRLTGARYLVDQSGTPFFFAGDSPWWLGTRLSTTDMTTYLNDRQTRGFNSLLIEVIDNVGGANSAGANANGDLPFTTVQGGGTYTNATTQSPDFSTPNSNYWNQIDSMMSLVKARGFLVCLYPIWIGALFTDPSTEGFYNALHAQSSTIRHGYGAFLGARYASYSNIVWIVGGDANPANGPGADTGVVTDVAAGIQSANPNATIFSVDSKDGNSPLTDTEAWTPASSLVNNGVNNIYSDQSIGHPYIQANAKTEWQRSDFPNVPYFLKEAKYEDGSTTPQYNRAQAWASLLGGCCGYHFGNTPLWDFGTNWQNQLGARGTLDTLVCFNVIQSRAWWLLVPDWGNAFLTNGGSYTNANFVPAATASDGSWGCLYTPVSQALTINMATFAVPQRIYWVDPTTGSKVWLPGSVFQNTGTLSIPATPSTNAQGDADWAIVFEAQPTQYLSKPFFSSSS